MIHQRKELGKVKQLAIMTVCYQLAPYDVEMLPDRIFRNVPGFCYLFEPLAAGYIAQ